MAFIRPKNRLRHRPFALSIFALKKILVAPLNWGLGHATRSIPIINALLERQYEVVLASDGAALQLLRAEFPGLESHELPSWDVRYFSENMVWNIVRQFPKMAWATGREHLAIEKLVADRKIDRIISDNRYGCFSKKIPSVILTHQLNLMVPGAAFQWLANQFLAKALSKFDEVWVPDFPGETNLSGALSHGKTHDFPVEFVGPLSRMRPADIAARREYDIAVVLSGPEPQRTFLEKKLMEQALSMPDRFLFVQGKTARKTHFIAAENIEVASFLTSTELQNALNSSEMVVCRSGYSSLMDLVKLQKKAVLIPTPGQTEQEHLARHFSKMDRFVAQNQRELDLPTAIDKLRRANFGEMGFPANDLLEKKLDTFK